MSCPAAHARPPPPLPRSYLCFQLRLCSRPFRADVLVAPSPPLHTHRELDQRPQRQRPSTTRSPTPFTPPPPNPNPSTLPLLTRPLARLPCSCPPVQGLIYDDVHGVYHLFQQYNPYGAEWGSMSWGHATSTDLISWTHWPVAILTGKDVAIFSGSAVLDTNTRSHTPLCPHQPPRPNRTPLLYSPISFLPSATPIPNPSAAVLTHPPSPLLCHQRSVSSLHPSPLPGVHLGRRRAR